MSQAVVAVEADDSVTTAIDRMLEYGVRSLPVVERRDGLPVLVGIVSRSDLLCCLRLQPERADSGSVIVAVILGESGRSRRT
ncbi:MAG: CBS domain-containing protein [Candidatus Rokubacteria bacterium]|nr:CBS domain-containing protein [Candidatus Rokubacteria bacterium]